MGALADLSLLPIVAAALSGAAFGFLVHNRHPAKVFMGDAGSLFLGFMLALLGIRLRFQNLPQVTFMVPVVVLGLPILDTTLVVISRLRNKRPIFLGGRDHVAHRLVAMGLPTRAAVYLMYVGAVCLGWLGLTISRAGPQVGFMLLGFVMALGLYLGVVLYRVPVYGEKPVQLIPERDEPQSAPSKDRGSPAAS
jgi:UDP-GlcNAc:undecaprenyl-phosphate GlcNAc-1-phosphate transferase